MKLSERQLLALQKLCLYKKQHQSCFFSDNDEKSIRRFVLQQSFLRQKEVCLYLHPLFNRGVMQTPQTGRTQSGETQTDRHYRLQRDGAWQRSDPHESLLRSESCLHFRYADPLPPPLHRHPPPSIFCSPSFISASPSLKLLIDSFTPARALAHLGQASTTRADFLINREFTPVHTVLHSSTGQNNDLRTCVGVGKCQRDYGPGDV